MPLHHSLGFPNMILEGGSFDPHDPSLDPPLFIATCVVTTSILTARSVAH